MLALMNGFINPDQAGFLHSVELVTMVVLGGLGSVVGSIVGAAVLVTLPQLLTVFQEYEHVLFGLIIILSMIFMRDGIVPDRCRSAGTKGARMTILEAKGIGISFGGVKAVDDVSFSVSPGQILSIIGPNGAGKTTLFNIVSGVYEAQHGRVHLSGKDVTGLRLIASRRSASPAPSRTCRFSSA